MKTFGFWKPIIGSLLVTPLALLLGIASAGAGHGDYFWAMVLFPYTMLSFLPFKTIKDPFIVLGIIQFPLYGLVLGLASQRRGFRLLAIVLALLHIVAAILSFVLLSENIYSSSRWW